MSVISLRRPLKAAFLIVTLLVITIQILEWNKFVLDSQCGCRWIKVDKGQTKSLCGDSATHRGQGQRVLSYSLYGKVGHENGYFKGIQINLDLMRQFYPQDFIMRIYHDGKSTEDLCEIFCSSPDVDLCNANEIGIGAQFGMLWRFAPMADPTVDEWHCRDLDSMPSSREVAAVDDWRHNSTANYHLMRDNPYHRASIVGCCFGMRQNNKNRETNYKIFHKMLEENHEVWRKGEDQRLLDVHLWPVAKRDMVCHDSYLCDIYANDGNRPFPTKRISSDDFKTGPVYNFVGSNGGAISLTSHNECPEKCRPENHLDWKLC